MRNTHPLARWMAREGLTQQEAAKRLGISQSAISDYITEWRVPRPRRLRKIAKVVGCDPGAFIPPLSKIV